MSTGRRAYDILRGWVSHEWDRIREIERDLAQQELQQSMETVRTPSANLESEVEQKLAKEDALEHARNLLGVKESASFEEIRRAFDKLNKRSDPARFPVNSSERSQAAEIQKRIHWAYQLLTESMDSIRKRFGSLELE
jgi:DnaJ-class molecular chaperone